MLRLRLKNPVTVPLAHRSLPHVAPNSPLKPKIHVATNRRFNVVSLPERDGSYVASVLEGPDILVYDKSRKAAEDKASAQFLRRPDRDAYRDHSLARTRTVTIDMEFDEETNSFVTYVKELHRMSTFGGSEMEALDNTAEMIRGYIKSMEANRMKIPLPAAKLAALKRLVGIR